MASFASTLDKNAHSERFYNMFKMEQASMTTVITHNRYNWKGKSHNQTDYALNCIIGALSGQTFDM